MDGSRVRQGRLPENVLPVWVVVDQLPEAMVPFEPGSGTGYFDHDMILKKLGLDPKIYMLDPMLNVQAWRVLKREHYFNPVVSARGGIPATLNIAPQSPPASDSGEPI